MLAVQRSAEVSFWQLSVRCLSDCDKVAMALTLQLKFHDDGPFLLITQSSFDDLSTRLVERNVIDHVTLEHFRPNITVSGDTPPFDEVSSGDSRLNFER